MKRRQILFIIISTFILVMAWIGFNVYHSSITSTISDTTNVRIAPIDPDFKAKAFEELKERKKVSPILEAQTQSTVTLTPTPSPSLSPVNQPTPTETTTQQATEEGTLAP